MISEMVVSYCDYWMSSSLPLCYLKRCLSLQMFIAILKAWSGATIMNATLLWLLNVVFFAFCYLKRSLSSQIFIAILKAWSGATIMNKNGIYVSPCNMLVSISKNSVSPSSDETSGKILYNIFYILYYIKYYCLSYVKNIREIWFVQENYAVLESWVCKEEQMDCN